MSLDASFLSSRPRILFVSESATLAHFARPFELSNQLSDKHYEIHFACAEVYQAFLQGSKHVFHHLESIRPEQFKQALDQGKPLYHFECLKNYVEDDLALIEAVKPDLIVGDFRISLAVSARLKHVPYATVSNAYWSPYAPKYYPLPCLPVARWLGVRAGSLLFKVVAPVAFKLHALAMQRLRKYYGLPGMKLDLRRMYTEADYTLYADLPSLYPLKNAPENHFFIGPVLWSPPVRKPDWWDSLPTDRPIIYVTMGSSGSEYALKKILAAFRKESVTVVASTAGMNIENPTAGNIYTAPFIDGLAMAAIADLVICNGGSLSCQQAFSHGKPVLAIASNMDQFLNMKGVNDFNAGLTLRADQLSPSAIIESWQAISQRAIVKENASKLMNEVKLMQNQQRFVDFVRTIF